MDNDKVEILISELSATENLTPLVIAANREALKPLANKVAEGINGSWVIVPVITKKSMSTQWLNQEIGYAQARGVKIMPIVEKGVINDLKGFIHKQIDLPYTFLLSDSDHNNDNFRAAIKTLINDLEKHLPIVPKVEPVKTPFEKSLDLADIVEKEQSYKKEKEKFLGSHTAFEMAQQEVLTNMFKEIREKINALHTRKMFCGTEEDNLQFLFMVNCEGFNLVIQFYLPYFNSLQESILYVKYMSSYAQPKEVKNMQFIFDKNEAGQIGWLNLKQRKLYLSQQIVDDGFAWIVEQVSLKRKGITEL